MENYIEKYFTENKERLHKFVGQFYKGKKSYIKSNVLIPHEWGDCEMSFATMEHLLKANFHDFTLGSNDTRKLIELMGYNPKFFHCSSRKFEKLTLSHSEREKMLKDENTNKPTKEIFNLFVDTYYNHIKEPTGSCDFFESPQEAFNQFISDYDFKVILLGEVIYMFSDVDRSHSGPSDAALDLLSCIGVCGYTLYKEGRLILSDGCTFAEFKRK